MMVLPDSYCECHSDITLKGAAFQEWLGSPSCKSVALFPAPDKNNNGGGEPGTNSHVRDIVAR